MPCHASYVLPWLGLARRVNVCVCGDRCCINSPRKSGDSNSITDLPVFLEIEPRSPLFFVEENYAVINSYVHKKVSRGQLAPFCG